MTERSISSIPPLIDLRYLILRKLSENGLDVSTNNFTFGTVQLAIATDALLKHYTRNINESVEAKQARRHYMPCPNVYHVLFPVQPS